MIVRQLKQSEFNYINKELIQKAHEIPLEAGYTVDMTINGVSYLVKLQTERHCKLAVLQALRISTEEDGQKSRLITAGALLSALLEILINQGI